MEIGACHFRDRTGVPSPWANASYFVCARKRTFGLADASGSWVKTRVVPGEYVGRLIDNAQRVVESRPKSHVDPMSVLVEAHRNTRVAGSSTACVVTITDDQCLHGVNLGDGGIMVVRGWHVVYKSKPQHKYKHPYQLGCGKVFDAPSVAEEAKVGLSPGDVVVVGTDGLFENTFGFDIIQAVVRDKEKGFSARIMAYDIARIALDNALARGGKAKDIAVLVAFVQRPASPRSFDI